MDTDVRADPRTIDARWMTDALEAAGVARGTSLTSVEFDGFVGTGQMSRNARLRLTWDGEAEGRPSSVVGKFPSDDATARVSAVEAGLYYHEYAFYSELASTLDVRTPTCFAARYDERDGTFTLILEDMIGSEQGNQLAGCSVDEVQLGIEQAVGLHAPRWGDPTLSGLAALAPTDEGRAELLEKFYGATCAPGLERLGARLDGDIVDVAQRFEPLVARWSAGTGTPQTIVHNDFRPDNFLFGRTPDAPPLVIVDWQTTSKSLGLVDVAYLIGGAFDPDQRAAVERGLVEDYRQRVNARSIPYTPDDCWRDYRWSSLWGIIIAVAATMMAEQTERGDAMLTQMIARHARHALDLEALSLLR
jgi:Phosphotransferase enzyme family